MINPYLAAAITVKGTDIGLPTSTNNLGAGLTNAITLLMSLIGGLSLIFVIVGALQIVLGGGNPARLKQGRETIIFAAVGIVVSIGAYAILKFVLGYL